MYSRLGLLILWESEKFSWKYQNFSWYHWIESEKVWHSIENISLFHIFENMRRAVDQSNRLKWELNYKYKYYKYTFLVNIHFLKGAFSLKQCSIKALPTKFKPYFHVLMQTCLQWNKQFVPRLQLLSFIFIFTISKDFFKFSSVFQQNEKNLSLD